MVHKLTQNQQLLIAIAESRVNSGLLPTTCTTVDSAVNDNGWLEDMEQRRHEDLPPPYALHQSAPKMPLQDRSGFDASVTRKPLGNENVKDVWPSYYNVVTSDAGNLRY